MDNDTKGSVLALGFVGVLIFGCIAFLMWLFPTYGVWRAGLVGKGSLMRAEQEKQIQIEQAKAELESAKLRAEAIQIVGKAAKDFPEYRTQEFLGAFGDALKEGTVDQIIYVPTEAGIPILESGRVSGGK